METIKALVDGGKASAGPPIGPALGPMGVNIMEVVEAINDATKDFEGMKVPVKIMVDPETKEYEIEVGTPPTPSLILSKLGKEKGSSGSKIGNLSMEEAMKIALMKKLLGADLKAKVKEVIGSCLSIGVTVEGKDPREAQKEIDEGVYDSLFD